MNGEMKWSGVSGVPGLGVSVDHGHLPHYDAALVLRLWDEAENIQSDSNQATLQSDGKSEDRHQKLSLGDKIASMFKLKRRNTVKVTSTDRTDTTSAHISVKRSQSMVTTRKNKLGHSDNKHDKDKNIQTTKVNLDPSRTNLDSDSQYLGDKSLNVPLKHSSYICQNCNSSKNIKPNIKRSVSYNHRGKKESKKQVLQRRETLLVTSNVQNNFHDYHHSNHHHLHHNLKVPNVAKTSSNSRQQSDRNIVEDHPRLSTLSTTATQTENTYDYAYSLITSPAKMIQDLDQDKTNDNIYEEIIPPDRRLFYSISKGRRENLELYKFADWDLEDKFKQPKTDKDNYIQPREIKSSLNKKSSLRKLKTKEHRSVTFASSEEDNEEERTKQRISLQRSKSVSVSSHTLSKHN